MNKDQMPEEIFDWLAHKDYKGLSKTEQNTVNKFMTSEEYKDFREVIYEFKNVNESLHIEPAQLETRKNSSYFTKLINYPIPAYQVAAGVLGIIGLFVFLQKKPDLSVDDAKDSLEVIESGKAISKDYYPDDLVFEL